MSDWSEGLVEGDVVKVFIGDNGSVDFDGEITADDVKQVAKDNGMKNFAVRKSGDLEKLTPEDLPIAEDIIIFQVNKAG